MRTIVPLLVATIAATGAACGPESFHRGGGEGGAVGGADGAGGTGGEPDLDAGGDAVMDGADPGGGEDAPADRADGDDAPSGDGGTTFTCPRVINGALETSDRTQVGRHSRFAPVSVCGAPKAYPGNDADPTNPHVFDAYRFVNPNAASVCLNFTLTYPTTDAGTANDRYLVAYTAFDPTDIMRGYLGDVGGATTSPQTMGITVAAGASIDVVVYAVQPTNLGLPYVGPYTLSCAAP